MQRILVVDDDALMRGLIAKALRDYDIVLAHGGDEALQLIAPGTRLDLLITDYLMPSMMGDELLGRIRERRPTLKTLVITGHGEVLARELPTWWTGQEHLDKPFTMAALRACVARLIGPPSGHS